MGERFHQGHKNSWIDEYSHRLPASLRKTEHGRWGIIVRECALRASANAHKVDAYNRSCLHLNARLNVADAHQCASLGRYPPKKVHRVPAPAAQNISCAGAYSDGFRSWVVVVEPSGTTIRKKSAHILRLPKSLRETERGRCASNAAPLQKSTARRVPAPAAQSAS